MHGLDALWHAPSLQLRRTCMNILQLQSQSVVAGRADLFHLTPGTRVDAGSAPLACSLCAWAAAAHQSLVSSAVARQLSSRSSAQQSRERHHGTRCFWWSCYSLQVESLSLFHLQKASSRDASRAHSASCCCESCAALAGLTLSLTLCRR